MSGREPDTSGVDYAALAEGMDQLREVLRAMVAGLVSDGFTDEQARRLVTRVLCYPQDGGNGE